MTSRSSAPSGGSNVHFNHGLGFDLQRREAELGRPIRVGLIGSGEMGTDIVTQCGQMRGITVAGIAEINVDAAKKAITIAGRSNFVVADSAAKIAAAIESGLVTKPIKKGELLTYENCAVDAGSKIVELRRRQDQLLAKG